MRITDVTTQIVNLDFRNCIIVEVETDAGVTGVAETVMKRRTLSMEQAILEHRSYLLGKDPTDIEDHWEKMYRDSFWVGGPMHATPISAIDCALWHILAQVCGVPVYKLLGGPTRRKVLVYSHCPAGSSPDEYAQNVRSCVRKGYRAIKTTLPLFYGNGNGGASYSGVSGKMDRCWKETEYLDPGLFASIREFFVAARETGGKSLGMAVDCHGRLGAKAAIALCRALEGLDLMFIEEPVPPEDVTGLTHVRQSTSIPIAAGERWATIYGVREFLERRAVDILQCDLVNAGGITAMKKIAAMAEAHHVGMAPHNPNGPLATMMNLHFAAMIPNFVILETIGSGEDHNLATALLDRPPRLEDGYLPVPCLPGWGVQLHETAIGALPHVPCVGWR
jgi:galactonate dehydratase